LNHSARVVELDLLIDEV
jgi:hypothetical protein